MFCSLTAEAASHLFGPISVRAGVSVCVCWLLGSLTPVLFQLELLSVCAEDDNQMI